jgi:hypothetical protein
MMTTNRPLRGSPAGTEVRPVNRLSAGCTWALGRSRAPEGIQPGRSVEHYATRYPLSRPSLAPMVPARSLAKHTTYGSPQHQLGDMARWVWSSCGLLGPDSTNLGLYTVS